MKINDVEQILGITKANIRFYEKEGLLTPGRTENGYRDYTQSDIDRLKAIVIYRKLGIPVQQIADILDGAVSLQDVLDANIKTLKEEIDKLNGSLALCQQLKAEDSDTLDTERYWDLMHTQEHQGMKFQSLLKDYAAFMEPTIDRYLMHVPAKYDRNQKMIVKYTALFALIFGAFDGLLIGNLGEGITTQFLTHFILVPIFFLILCIFYIPAYLIGKKHPTLGKILKILIAVIVIFTALFYFTWKAFRP